MSDDMVQKCDLPMLDASTPCLPSATPLAHMIHSALKIEFHFARK